MQIKYGCDEPKRLRTRAERGVDFVDAVGFDWDTALVIVARWLDSGKPCWRALGQIDGRLRALALSLRGDICRVIGLRKANQREQRIWDNI